MKPIHNQGRSYHIELVAVFVLVALAFALRFHRLDFYSLSEDESAKWVAIQDYRHGHFAGVNSEHPMLPKMLAWASLAAGERWNQLAFVHHWSSLKPEGWIRLPNVILGSLTTGILYLFCRQMMGVPGSLAASFFWAVSPLAIALNRLTKEETPVTFFTLLACYLYCRAKQPSVHLSARHWYDLSAIAFGLALASQYIIHLLGLNALAWLIAGRKGLDPNPPRFSFKRFYLLMFVGFTLVNPVILSPHNLHTIVYWFQHGGASHTGYDFDGRLYVNFPSKLFAGVPWFYYVWLLLVKTPLLILLCVAAGSILLLRHRRTLASCYFLSMGIVQLAGLSVSGAKWIRYSLPILPFLYLAGGYAVQQTWRFAMKKELSLRLVWILALILVAVPLVELMDWAPYYSFYLNAIGGGKQRIGHYFAQDEVTEFDTREVAQKICNSAPESSRLATARPMSLRYYLETCGRSDLIVVPLYDRKYVPQDRDIIVLEPSRRFFETQKFFTALENSGLPHDDVRVGPILSSTIYLFDSSAQSSRTLGQGATVAQVHSPSQSPGTHAPGLGLIDPLRFESAADTRRFAP